MKSYYIHFSSINSTNLWAKENLSSLDPHSLNIITADEQTEGRGQNNRIWISPGNNIYVTFHHCVLSTKPIINISQVLSISICEVLNNLGVNPTIKWPNDILINNCKISGILAEILQKPHCQHLIVGAGININMSKELETINPPATSLYNELNQMFNPSLILKSIEKNFKKHLNIFLKYGFLPLFPLLQKYDKLKGTSIKFNDGKNIWEGKYLSFNHNGSFSIATKNGKKTFWSGKIIHTETP